jgi:hypothetical protein
MDQEAMGKLYTYRGAAGCLELDAQYQPEFPYREVFPSVIFRYHHEQVRAEYSSPKHRVHKDEQRVIDRVLPNNTGPPPESVITVSIVSRLHKTQNEPTVLVQKPLPQHQGRRIPSRDGNGAGPGSYQQSVNFVAQRRSEERAEAQSRVSGEVGT